MILFYFIFFLTTSAQEKHINKIITDTGKTPATETEELKQHADLWKASGDSQNTKRGLGPYKQQFSQLPSKKRGEATKSFRSCRVAERFCGSCDNWGLGTSKKHKLERAERTAGGLKHRAGLRLRVQTLEATLPASLERSRWLCESSPVGSQADRSRLALARSFQHT